NSKETTKVSTESDLDANSVLLAFKYHLMRTLVILGLVVAFWIVSRPILRLENRPTHELANAALEANSADNDDVWDVLYRRLKLQLKNDVRDLSFSLKKPKPNRSPIELFDYIHDRLRLDWALENRKFENARE